MIDYVFPFENRGAEVGATLHHPHGQIYAYPVVPPVPARMLEQARALPGQAPGAGCCETMIEAECARRRAHAVSGRSRRRFRSGVRPIPVRMLGRADRAVPQFGDLDDAERADVARALKTVLLKYDGLWRAPCRT